MGTARDNSGRAVTGGYAVPRSGAPYGGSWRDGRRYPRYNSYLLYGYGGFGLGYLYYDPFWWGYGGYPYGYYGYPYGYGYGYGYDYDRGYTDYTDSGNEQPVEENAEPAQSAHGGLKLKVTPANAEVYIDGYFKGIVSDFSGMFERIELPVGPHRVEIRARGYQTITFEIRIEPHETITYRGEMDPANRK